MNLATKKMADKYRFDLSTTPLKLDPLNEYYQTHELTHEFAQARAVAAGNPVAPSKPQLEPPAGGFKTWLEQASRWMIYVMSPGNGEVQELLTRRAQYLENMGNPKKVHNAFKNFNDVNVKLRDKFLLPPRDKHKEIRDARKNDDDVSDFLRANNLMK